MKNNYYLLDLLKKYEYGKNSYNEKYQLIKSCCENIDILSDKTTLNNYLSCLIYINCLNLNEDEQQIVESDIKEIKDLLNKRKNKEYTKMRQDSKIILFRFTNKEELNNFRFKINNSVEFSNKITENHRDIVKDLKALKENINCEYIILKQLVEKDNHKVSIIPVYMANIVYTINNNDIFISKYRDHEISRAILNKILKYNNKLNVKESVNICEILKLKRQLVKLGMKNLNLDENTYMNICLNILEQDVYDDIINKIREFKYTPEDLNDIHKNGLYQPVSISNYPIHLEYSAWSNDDLVDVKPEEKVNIDDVLNKKDILLNIISKVEDYKIIMISDLKDIFDRIEIMKNNKIFDYSPLNKIRNYCYYLHSVNTEGLESITQEDLKEINNIISIIDNFIKDNRDKIDINKKER